MICTKLGDTKGIITSCNSKKGRHYNDQKKSTKGQTMINNTPDRKLKVWATPQPPHPAQKKPQEKPGMNWCTPEG